MATRAITYVWKIQRPPNEVVARIFMAAAYQTAMKVDPGVTTVLIRSPIHSSTFLDGHYVKDDPHITICSKNSTQEELKTHEAAHGYTVSLEDPTLVRIEPSDFVKPDEAKDRRGRMVWPTGLHSEVVMHTDP
ncbi:MAG: hypothetical protein Q9207_005135 [Kuettlingeria erythrocarpa]